MNGDYFIHKGKGVLQYDPGEGTRLWEPHWAIVIADQGIVDYYAWLARKWGMPVMRGSTFGPHVTFIRGEAPPMPAYWGLGAGEVEFWYSNVIRTDNGRHAWIDVYSERLTEIRAALGYPPKPAKTLADGRVLGMSYHLTIGRLV